MSAYNTTLLDEDNNEIYPKTLAENVYDGNVRMDQKVDGIRTDLGSPSSASAVTGADAFSKISKLNSDLTSMRIKAFSLKSGSPLRFYISAYGVALILGFVNGVGSKCILIQKSGSSVSCIDMSDNSVWSSAHFDIHIYSSDNNYIEITSDRSGSSAGTYLTGF